VRTNSSYYRLSTFRFVRVCSPARQAHYVPLHLRVYHLASPRIFTFRSAACPRPSPSVRMIIRLSGSLQLLLRLCAYHLASPRIFTFRSAARPRPSPSVRMTIRLSRSLQLSLRLCAYHLAKSPHLYVPLRSLSAFQSVRAYDHSSKRDSTTFVPSVCASFRLNTASQRSTLRSVSKYDSPSKRI